MGNIKMNGLKQLGLELLNFVVNIFFAVILMVIFNLLYLDTNEYNRDVFRNINIIFTILFLLYLLFQNVFFRSIFYFFAKFKIQSNMKKEKLGVILHNFLFTCYLFKIETIKITKQKHENDGISL